ncbi:monovalent cation:H+ antiporter, CPA1 (nhx1) [Stylosanthes scabra]|uniref:Monovalent cation:H+ antiporter, CPA1 (Nhx1) n=1 Tax=Stylosanthes scabra TaxID=79078 RepID=A0ABU6R9W3_9FABA|nr:monovalent cation:H+ antiporter, CPA1 (nhx1) [Stylosanthes scabra]
MAVDHITYLLSKLQALSTSDHSSVVSMNIFVALLCACIVLGHLLEENRWMNESITALVIGICTGVLILMLSGGRNSHILVFSEDLFFIYLLPPIIFNAGIVSGVAKTFKSIGIHSLEIADYLAIGAIFSATDSVCTLQILNQDETPLLYSLVFGEGVVNDATSVVLFNAIQSFDINQINPSIGLQFVGNFLYLFTTSTLLGVLTGLLSAYIVKKLYIGRHSTDREFALMMLMAYLSYMMAEVSFKDIFVHAFATLSFVAETFIFLYVGMDALDIDKWRFASDRPGTSVAVSSVLLGLVLAGRAAFVFPLSFISNITRKSSKEGISFRQQVIIWWAGLMRGAVSMALAYNQFTLLGHTAKRANAIMITSTITVVLFSTVVFGLMTKPLIRFLLPVPTGNTPKRKSSVANFADSASPKAITVPFLSSGQDSEANLEPQESSYGPTPRSIRDLLSTPTHSVHRLWRKFDNSFMRPVFGGRGFVPSDRGPPTERSTQNQWH